MESVKEYGKIIIPVMIVSAFIALVFFWAIPTKAEPQDTYHSGWKLIRETADEDAADFATVYDLTTKGNFANKNSASWETANGGPFNIRSYAGSGVGTEFQSVGGAWMFAICGECFNGLDDTFSFHILGWSRINGMMQVIAEGDGVLGDQAVIAYPDDSADALGATATGTDVDYTASTHTYQGSASEFDGAIENMMAYVTSGNDSNLTSGFYEITTYTDVNTIIMTGDGGSSDTTATVQINPAFWADVINLDETTKWPSVEAYNSEAGSGQMAFIVIDTTGLEWIQFVIYAADAATDEEAGKITVYGRVY